MKIVIVGGGTVGLYLAKTLLEHDHEPSIVEPNKAVCARLANTLDIPIIAGDGTTIEDLQSAGAAGAAAGSDAAGTPGMLIPIGMGICS